MGKYERITQNPQEIDALDEVANEQHGLAEDASIVSNVVSAVPEDTDELLAAGIENENAEEEKVEGINGHEEVAGGAENAPPDELDELVDGAIGEGASGPSDDEVYTESSIEQLLDEVEGYTPELDEFEGEQLERVFGRDDRVRVGNTTSYPWRTICKLEIEAANGRRYGCTGAFIGPRTVLTNGHCVYMHGAGGWARSIRVIPGKNGSSEPFGSAVSTFYHSVTGWTQSRSSNYDYAVIVLPSNNKLGNVVGWMGLANLSVSSLMGLRVNNSGYPGDKPSCTQWWNANNILAVTDRRVYYRIDTFNGQSGSPVWRFRDNQRHIASVHNTGEATYNGSVRIVKPVLDNLVAWKRRYT